MAVILKDIIKIAEEIAPLSIAESYDNPGLMVGSSNKEVKSVLVSMDLTEEVIDEAISKSCDVIFTHHPPLFKPLKSINTDTVSGRKAIKLIKNDISVYSSHTNFDKAKGGLNDALMDILGFNNYISMESDKESGIGRIANIDEIEFSKLLAIVSEKLETKALRYTGDLNKKIKIVAAVNGAGSDFIEKAIELGADCFITGDTKYHEMLDAKEEGICVIDAGHFPTEWKAFKKVMDNLRKEIEKNFGEIEFVFSEKNHDVYSLYL